MIVGITGAFGCGKSTCLKIFADLQFAIISADQICHSLYEEKNPILCQELLSRWGSNIFNQNNEFNRKKIAEIVFSNKNELDFLTSVLNPLITDKIMYLINEYKNDNRHLIIEIPLLFEENYQKVVDKTIVVFASMENRIENLKKRNFEQKDIIQRDKRQLALEKKVELADYVIINGGSLEFLKMQVCKIIKNLNI